MCDFIGIYVPKKLLIVFWWLLAASEDSGPIGRVISVATDSHGVLLRQAHIVSQDH